MKALRTFLIALPIAWLVSLQVAPAFWHGLAPAPAGTSAITALGYGTVFQYNSTYPPQTVGSDTWSNTWADDGNIYTLSDDMSINWNAPNTSCCNVEVSTLSSSTSAVVGTQINAMSAWGSETQTGSDSNTYKGFGFISISSNLYMFVTRQAATTNGSNQYTEQNATIIKSSNHGTSFTPAPPSTAAPYASPMFPSASYANFAVPYFVQYGQDYAGNAVDNAGTYVYAISNDGFWSNGSSLVLGRVKISNIGNQSASDWSFYTGGDGMSDANWSAAASSAMPILSNSLKLSSAAVQYVPSLGRYLMMDWYYPSIPGALTTSDTHWIAYEALHPWGPWTAVQEDEWTPSGLYSPVPISKSLASAGPGLVTGVLAAAGDFSTSTSDTGFYTLTYVPTTISANVATVFDPANLGTGNSLFIGNRTVTQVGSGGFAYRMARSQASYSTGKYYAEYNIVANEGNPDYLAVGLANASASISPSSSPGTDANLSAAMYGTTPGVYINNSAVGLTDTVAQGDCVGEAVDFGAHLIWLRTITGCVTPQNWNNSGSANPATGTGGISFSSITGPYYAAVWMLNNSQGRIVANFGALPYAATAPVGFISLPNNLTAQRVQPLVNSVAVNTHIYQGGIYSTLNIISDLAYLGINTVRDYPLQYFSQTTNYNTLAAAGVKFDFNLAGEGCNNNHIAALMPAWITFIGSYPGALVTMEGMNEINNQPVCYLNEPTTNATTASGNPTLHFASTLVSLQAAHSGALDAGMTIADVTAPTAISGGTVQSSAAATTVTMSANAAGPGVGSGDTIEFEANAAQTNTQPANNAAAVAYQQDIYTQTHASLSGVNVLNFTGCCSAVGVVGSADFNNMHDYATYGLQPLGQFSTFYGETFVAGLGPMQATETGYYTAGSTPGGSLIGTDGVDQLTQARYLLNTVADFWNNGLVKTYLYEMADEACDPGNTNASDHYGLFDCNNNPKTAATAFQNFHTILNDSGGTALTFTPGQLNYTISTLPAPNTPSNIYGGYQLLFEKSNGTFEIVIWNEPFAWDHSVGDVTILPTTVTISLGHAAATVNVYDPVTGPSATNTYSNTSSVSVSLAADMQIVEVTP